MKDLLIEKMYELTKKPYQKLFKKGIVWNVTPKELITYKEDSLGFHLGCFLLKYNFEYYTIKNTNPFGKHSGKDSLSKIDLQH